MVILINQIVIFGACFAPYCLIAALPHTGIIAALITYFSNESKIEDNKSSFNQKTDSNVSQFKNINLNNFDEYSEPKNKIKLDDLEEVKDPHCPKCGSKMVLRTARRGKFSGQKFWGCSKYPNCNGILNI